MKAIEVTIGKMPPNFRSSSTMLNFRLSDENVQVHSGTIHTLKSGGGAAQDFRLETVELCIDRLKAIFIDDEAVRMRESCNTPAEVVEYTWGKITAKSPDVIRLVIQVLRQESLEEGRRQGRAEIREKFRELMSE